MQKNLFQNVNKNQFLSLTKEQLAEFFEEQNTYTSFILNKYNSIEKERNDLIIRNKELQDKILIIEGRLVLLRRRIFRKKSEKIIPDKNDKSFLNKNKTKNGDKKRRAETITKLPSERYPEAEIIEEHLLLETPPTCACCQSQMTDSGMTEDSEFIETKPKDYYIIRQKRHKYRCTKCHGSLVTTPAPKKIIQKSPYSDNMIIDVALTKYCDLIPIERYTAIAGREDLIDLPPNSLIGTTHKLAEYFEPVYNKVKGEILSSKILHADETPHRMLEDSDAKSWYLWGFSNNQSSYFEIRNTRSGDVSSEILNQSKCEYLVSDVYCGYSKSTNIINKSRIENKLTEIRNIYCNAHSRRYFLDAEKYPEHQFYIEQYHAIYELERAAKEDVSLLPVNRNKMKDIFSKMKEVGESQLNSFPKDGTLVTAIKYFLKNYVGLTRFTENIELPIDNNHQERLLRNAVIGRKTWYGTHSKQGAKTAAILFSLVESCKLNKVNPREYFKKVVVHLHNGKDPLTPKEFKELGLDSG